MSAEESFDYGEVISRGEEAARLLQSPVFNLAYQSVVNELTGRFFKTEAGHTNTLQEIRREGNALAKVAGMLAHWVQQAEAEIARNKPQNTEEYRGFGVNPN